MVIDNNSLPIEMKTVIRDFIKLINITHQQMEPQSKLTITEESLCCLTVQRLPRQQDAVNCGIYCLAFVMGFNSCVDIMQPNDKQNPDLRYRKLHCGSICNFRILLSLTNSDWVQTFRARLVMILSDPLFTFCFASHGEILSHALQNGGPQNSYKISDGFVKDAQESGITLSVALVNGGHINNPEKDDILFQETGKSNNDPQPQQQSSEKDFEFSSKMTTEATRMVSPAVASASADRKVKDPNKSFSGMDNLENSDSYVDTTISYMVYDTILQEKNNSSNSSNTDGSDTNMSHVMWADEIADEVAESIPQKARTTMLSKKGKPENCDETEEKQDTEVPLCMENFQKTISNLRNTDEVSPIVLSPSQSGRPLRTKVGPSNSKNPISACNNSVNDTDTGKYYKEFQESLQEHGSGYQDIIYPSSLESDDSDFKFDWEESSADDTSDSYESDPNSVNDNNLGDNKEGSDSSDSDFLTWQELYYREKLREQIYQDKKKKKIERELKSDPIFQLAETSSSSSSSNSGDECASSSAVSFTFTEEDPWWRISSLRELKAIHALRRTNISFTKYVSLLLDSHPTLVDMSTKEFISTFELEMDTMKKKIGRVKNIYSKQTWHQLPKRVKEILKAASIMISGDKKLLGAFYVDMRQSSSTSVDEESLHKRYDGTSVDIDSLRGMDSHLHNVIPAGGGTVIMSGRNTSSLKKELPKSISFKLWDNKAELAFKELKEVPHFQLMTSRNQKSKIFLCLPNFESGESCRHNFVLKENYRRELLDTLIIPSITAMNTPNERINFFSSTRIAMEKSRNEKGQLGTSQIDFSEKGVQLLSNIMREKIAASDDIHIQQAFDFFFLYQVDDIKQFTRVYFKEKEPNKAGVPNTISGNENESFNLSLQQSVTYDFEDGKTLYSELQKLSDIRPLKLDTLYRVDVGYHFTF